MKDLLQILKPADKILQSREVGYVDALRDHRSTHKNRKNRETEGDQEDEEENEEMGILQRLYPVRAAFEKVYKLYCAVETFACSTAIFECLFSCLARVGILGRVHMTNERLWNLSFLAFESKEFKKVPVEAMLRQFISTKNRKWQIF